MVHRALASWFLAVLWALFLASCSGMEEAKVVEVLETRRLGLEKRDIGLYMSSVSPQYGGGGEDVDHLRLGAMQMMEGFDSIEMRIDSRHIEVRGAVAEAIQTYRLKVWRDGRMKEMTGKERITLEKETGGWKIVSGL